MVIGILVNLKIFNFQLLTDLHVFWREESEKTQYRSDIHLDINLLVK